MIIACPKCQSKYQVKDDIKATKVKCKKCQAIIEIKRPEARQRSEMKTAVPPPPPAADDAGSRAEMKTAVPPSENQARQKSEMKTVVPSEPEPARQRSEMKTAPPPPSEPKAEARQRSEMKTAASAPDAAPTEKPAADDGSDPLIGKTLGGYEVLRKLGEGGMGAVYEARQVALDRSVALKVLPSHLAANKDFITRFTREALSVARLNHNNIIQIHDIGKEEGTYFFSMEFVRGTNIGDMIEKDGKMDAGAAVGYILQSARGLEYAHRHNVVHRDIKPDNIMVSEEDIAKVADLGLAKQVDTEELSVTMSGVGMGTPVYMSPEQGSDAKNVDRRADIYSLGCTLYHMITGKIPFEGASAYEIITKHVNEPVTPPSVVDPDISDELSEIIKTMLAKKCEDRYQSMTEVIEALEGYLGVDFAQAGFVPTEGQIGTLQEHAGVVASAAGSPVMKLAGLVLSAVVVLAGLFAAFSGKPRTLLGVVLFGVVACVFYAFLLGTHRKTYLYRRIRQYIFGNKFGDWITIVVVLIAVAALIVLLAPGALAGAILGLAAAAALFFAVKKPLLGKLDAAVEEVRKLAREVRRKGIPDESIDLFVCRHGGKYGEIVCEEMSGYEAVLATRGKRSQEELEKEKRPLYTSVREGIIHWLDKAEEKREADKRAARGAPAEAEAEAAPQVEGAPPGAATAVMIDPTQPGSAETEALVAEIVEEKKPKANLAVAIPKFVLGGKGRVTLGAVLFLLAVLSLSNTLFGGSAILKNYTFAVFAVALMFSGFVHSKATIALLLLSAAAGLAAVIKGSDAEFILSKQIVGSAKAGKPLAQVTYGFLLTLALFILAFVAGFLFKGGKGEGESSERKPARGA